MEDKPRRPLGIVMIVGLEIVHALIQLADLALDVGIMDSKAQDLAAGSLSLRAILVTWIVAVVVASVLLWRLDRRGWALMMVLVGVSLFANLIIWWTDPARTQWLSMALSVLTAFYLNTASVRGLFVSRHEVSRLTLTDRTPR